MGLAELLTAGRTAVLALVAAATLASCVSCVDGNDQRAPDVVATVGDAEVTAAEIRARLPAEDTGPPVLRAGADPPDRWRDALDLAVRDELLSLEAIRRDPDAVWAADPAGRAARIRAVVEDERTDTPTLVASGITDEEAKAWFADNHALFDAVRNAHVTWAVFTDGDRARTVMDSATGPDQARFLQVARDHGASTGSAVLDPSGNGADVMVARVAFAVREADEVGMIAGTEGNWWVVRVDRIELATPAWTDDLAGRARAAMAWEREQSHLDSLGDRLRSRWPVAVDEQRFADSRPDTN